MSNRSYFRPIPCAPSMPGASTLAGGSCSFREVEVLRRGDVPQVLPIDAVVALYPESVTALDQMSTGRSPIVGLDMSRPKVMGIVNITPDSFSDGGTHATPESAIDHAFALVEAGADLLDIGGESTRPGAVPVPVDEELERVIPVIQALVAARCNVPLSIDTRKAAVAHAALDAGAVLFNDVSALTFDPESVSVAASAHATCLMHSRGNPETMQNDLSYDDVLLDIYDYLEFRLSAATLADIDPATILLDPGIGFAKSTAHNVALIARLSLFHGLGCCMLVGVSRKGFIGRLSGEREAARRVPGSIAAGLASVAQGAQILRVHDVSETLQALKVWEEISGSH
ncbi:MAG: dihydropteroate synthase [Pseudomonadota bacterium]